MDVSPLAHRSTRRQLNDLCGHLMRTPRPKAAAATLWRATWWEIPVSTCCNGCEGWALVLLKLNCGREWPLSVQLSTHHTRHWIMLQKWSSQRQAHPPRDEEWRSADRTACELSARDIMTTPLGSLPYICLLRKTTRRVIQLCCSHNVSIQILPDFWRSQKFSLNINRQTDTAQWKRIFPFCQQSGKSARLIV